MRDQPTSPPLPPSPDSPPPLRPVVLTNTSSSGLFATPMVKGTGLGSALESLLKHPGAALYEFTQGTRSWALSRSLLLIMVTGLALFGLAAVDLTRGIQWWATPLKLIAGLLLSALLCLPSLYIFSCLSGLEIRFKAVIGLLLASLSLSSLLLAGFTPVIWVFSQSSDSLTFMGAVMILTWSISLFFGFKSLSNSARAIGMKQSLHLRLWMFIFMVVTFQMSCALRPLLGPANTFLPTQKKFFLQHWGEHWNVSGLGSP